MNSEHEPTKKIDILVDFIKSKNWEKALSLASSFPRLGSHKKVITRAHEMIVNPKFYIQLGYNEKETILKGVDALKERYSKYL